MGRNIFTFLEAFLKIFLHFPPWIRTSRGAEGGPLWTPRFSSSRGAVQRSKGAAAYPGSMVIRALAYKQIEPIAEMSDLVDRISTVERSLQGSPFTGSDPTRRSLTPPRHALMTLPSIFDRPLVTCHGEVHRSSRFSTSEGQRSTHR